MFGRRAKIRKAVNQALARVADETDLADHAPVEALKPELRVQADYTLAQSLVEDDRYAAEKQTQTRTFELDPEAADDAVAVFDITARVGEPNQSPLYRRQGQRGSV